MTRNRMIVCLLVLAALFVGGFTSATPRASAVPPNQGWNSTTLGEWNTFWSNFVSEYSTIGTQYGWGNAATLWTKAYNNGLANWKLNGYAYINGWPLAFWDGFIAYYKGAGLTGASATAQTTTYNSYIIWHLDFAPAGYPIP